MTMFAGKTILYIEDEMVLAELILDELRELGLKCIHTPSYPDAVKKANFQKYDAIITDIRLEQGTGDELITLIKTNPKHVNYETHIIVTSAYITNEIQDSISGKVKAILNKPHSMDDLINTLKKCII